MCGCGCFRVSDLHTSTYHAWTDFQITSHVLLLCAAVFSVYHHFYELTLMLGTVVFSSIWYHRNKEEFGLVVCANSFCAKTFLPDRHHGAHCSDICGVWRCRCIFRVFSAVSVFFRYFSYPRACAEPAVTVVCSERENCIGVRELVHFEPVRHPRGHDVK